MPFAIRILTAACRAVARKSVGGTPETCLYGIVFCLPIFRSCNGKRISAISLIFCMESYASVRSICTPGAMAGPALDGLVAMARGKTPDPIPNSAVKTLSADGTAS